MDYIKIEAKRQGYSIDQVNRTITVQELIDMLSQFEPDMPVYLSHDNNYTYGGIVERDIEEVYEED